MAKQHPLRSLRSLHDFTVETPSPCPPSLKLKSLLLKVQILGYARHAVRSLSSAKSMAMELLSQKRRKKKRSLSLFKRRVNWPFDSNSPAKLPSIPGYSDRLAKSSEASEGDGEEGTEIDQLAEEFIASCHEKFRLEKQESYRRYQEMLARSI